MSGLFDIEVEKEISGALSILRTAADQYGVPWPYNEDREIKMLRLMHRNHPATDLESVTEGFMIWCMGDEDRVKRIKNWPQTLWTRVKNEERFKYGKSGGVRRSGATATGHNVVSQTLATGW